MPLVSVIVRTKNEERWITACLGAVFSQEFTDFEVILVDNVSTDKTVEKARQFPVAKIITCDNFKPGLALNMGIRESTGKYIVCLSGHCIPVNNSWLSSLIRDFDDASVAAVYGRQEALAFTPSSDKRDLAIIFGLDKKVQMKDSFFHNANSMLRRDLWDKTPFDELATNIEDRIWAEKILRQGFKIVYEPEASVYHYHGIHHGGNQQRCAQVVGIMEQLNPTPKDNFHIDIDNLNIVAVIPVKGKINYLHGRPLLEYTLDQVMGSKYVKTVYVSTDNPELAEAAKKLGAKVPFLRGDSLSEDFVDIEKVLQYSLEEIEKESGFLDVVVYLEETFPFRPPNLIDGMIKQLIDNGFDSVIAGKKEFKSIWKVDGGMLARIDEGDIPRKYKDPSFIGIKGLCSVTLPEFLRGGSLLGERIGICEVDGQYAQIEVRDEEDLKMAEKLIDFFKS